MIREDTFRISRRPYAVKLDTLRLTRCDRADGTCFWRGDIDAVWFRRRDGRTMACVGFLWDFQDEKPADAEAFLLAHTDGTPSTISPSSKATRSGRPAHRASGPRRTAAPSWRSRCSAPPTVRRHASRSN